MAWSRKSQDVKILEKFLLFWKNDPLLYNFQNSIPNVFIATQIDVLCSNVVKFGRRKFDEIGVSYLT